MLWINLLYHKQGRLFEFCKVRYNAYGLIALKPQLDSSPGGASFHIQKIYVKASPISSNSKQEIQKMYVKRNPKQRIQ